MHKRLLSALMTGVLIAGLIIAAAPQPVSAQPTSFDTQLVQRANEFRSSIGRSPLTHWSPLSTAAFNWSTTMSRPSTSCIDRGSGFRHDPGQSVGAPENPPGTTNFGENIAWACGVAGQSFPVMINGSRGWPRSAGPLPSYCVDPMDYTTADFTMCGWLSSAGHRQGLSNPSFTHLGSGTLLRQIDGGTQVWSTHRFTASTPSAPSTPGYHPVNPARIYDSRSSNAPWGPRETRAIQVSGRGGIPANATAVAVHVTSVSPSADTYVTAYPTGSSRPLAASKNFGPGAEHTSITNDLVIVRVGNGGSVSLYNNAGNTHLVLDVVGYFSPTSGAAFVGLNPARIYDSRSSNNPWSPRQDRAIQVTGRGGVPSGGVTAVAVHVTSVSPSADTYVTAYPTGAARPLAASKNFGPGPEHEAITNDLLIVPVGAGGTISLFNNAGRTHLVLDVVGYFSEASASNAAVSIAPARVYDSRTLSNPWSAGESRSIQIAGRAGVPSNARSVLVHVTSVSPTADSYATVFPTGSGRPFTASKNFGPGNDHTSIANDLLIVPLGVGGQITIYNNAGSTHLVLDVVGYS